MPQYSIPIIEKVLICNYSNYITFAENSMVLKFEFSQSVFDINFISNGEGPTYYRGLL